MISDQIAWRHCSGISRRRAEDRVRQYVMSNMCYMLSRSAELSWRQLRFQIEKDGRERTRSAL